MTTSTAQGDGPPVLPRAARVAVGISVALSLLSLAVTYHPLTRDGGEVRAYLDVFGDANLPTWWSTTLLTACTLAYIVAGVAARIARAPGVTAWFTCAMLLALLSLAKHTDLHHRLAGLGRQLLEQTPWTTDWVLLGAVAGVGAVAAVTVVASSFAGRARLLVLVGSAVLLGGELAARLLTRGGPDGGVDGGVDGAPITVHAAELGENLGAALLLAAALGTLEVTRRQAVLRVRYRTITRPGGPKSEAQAEPQPAREVVA